MTLRRAKLIASSACQIEDFTVFDHDYEVSRMASDYTNEEADNLYGNLTLEQVPGGKPYCVFSSVLWLNYDKDGKRIKHV